MKYYAVIKGRGVENKIYTTWDECSSVVKGFKGAKYKSFTSEYEAKSYLQTGLKTTLKEDGKYDKSILHAYVDGSYNKDLEQYGSGIAYVFRGVLYEIDSFANSPVGESNSWQIEGELMASLRVMEECKSANIKDIVIFHDYEGVAAHALGTWKRGTQLSEMYYNMMQDYMKDINVTFVRTKAHTGDIFNEIADELAKYKIGIKSTNAVQEYLCNNKLKVMDEDLKFRFEAILGQSSNKIESIS